MNIQSTTTLVYKVIGLEFNGIELTSKITYQTGFIVDDVFSHITTNCVDVNTEDTISYMSNAPSGASVFEAVQTTIIDYLTTKGFLVGV